MQNQNIKQIVEDTVRRQGVQPVGYQRVVDAVVEALSAAADTAAESIRQAARSADVDSDEVESVLVASGLVEQRATAAVADDASLGERLGKVEETLGKVVDLARRRLGVTI